MQTLEAAHMEDAAYQKGVEQFGRMLAADDCAVLRSRLAAVAPDFERLVMGFVGGEVWSRPNLDPKSRSLCSLGILAGLGRINALELNCRMAVSHGATRAEIVEVLIQVAAYAGFAAAWDGLERIDRVLSELEGTKPSVPA